MLAGNWPLQGNTLFSQRGPLSAAMPAFSSRVAWYLPLVLGVARGLLQERPLQLQHGNVRVKSLQRPLRTKSAKRPTKAGKRPINKGKRPIKTMVLVGMAVGCLMGCFRAPPPSWKTAPLKRPINCVLPADCCKKDPCNFNMEMFVSKVGNPCPTLRSCSKAGQLLVNSSPTPHRMGSCRGLPCSSPLATPDSRRRRNDKNSLRQ